MSSTVRTCFKLILVILVLAVCGYAIAYWFSPFNRRSFDKAAWAQGNEEERASMTYDAIRHLPQGMPENEIEVLLGAPMEITPIRSLQGVALKGTARTYVYSIGSWPLAAFDSTHLRVHVDAERKVVGAVIGGY